MGGVDDGTEPERRPLTRVESRHENTRDKASEDDLVESLIEWISAVTFVEWWHARERRLNVREGRAWANKPNRRTPPRKQTPSQLLQCHRKVWYRQLNAPREDTPPRGIFWLGMEIEEAIIEPYLDTVAHQEGLFVQNSIWTEFTVQTDAGEATISGATDPVIVDEEGRPFLLTEVKTVKSLDSIDEPKTRHRAQVHAYLYGLTESFDRSVTDAVIIYVDREQLTIRPFHVAFDPWFWRDTVLRWMGDHTEQRLNDSLPPAQPEEGWECSVCSYRQRCGKTQHCTTDEPAVGFVPLSEYPREAIEEHLRAEGHTSISLTPTLAHEYPDLATAVDVCDWECEGCQSRFEWDTIEWQGDVSQPPTCPTCASRNVFARLSGPRPSRRSG